MQEIKLVGSSVPTKIREKPAKLVLGGSLTDMLIVIGGTQRDMT